MKRNKKLDYVYKTTLDNPNDAKFFLLFLVNMTVRVILK
jgi:hypothetical protein